MTKKAKAPVAHHVTQRQAQLRRKLEWALGWIEYCKQVPSNEEEEDRRKYFEAKALVRRAVEPAGEVKGSSRVVEAHNA